MRIFLAGLQFLTILPLPIKPSKEELGKSIVFFPLVGLLIGGLLAGIYWIGVKILPSSVVIVLLMIIWIIITGAIHLDGFADTLDGFYAGKTKEERLKIMRDKYIGVMGITGIVIILLLKYNLLLYLSLTYSHIIKALILTPALSRWGIVAAASISPYVREKGKGKVFSEAINPVRDRLPEATDRHRRCLISNGVKWWYASFQGVILLVLSIWLFKFVDGMSVIAGLLVFLWLSALFFQKRIGGVTGDTLGAVNEVGEVLILIFIVLGRMG